MKDNGFPNEKKACSGDILAQQLIQSGDQQKPSLWRMELKHDMRERKGETWTNVCLF